MSLSHPALRLPATEAVNCPVFGKTLASMSVDGTRGSHGEINFQGLQPGTLERLQEYSQGQRLRAWKSTKRCAPGSCPFATSRATSSHAGVRR
jgi:hypothetical protein